MRILITLAWRNLWRNRKRTLITISSVLFALVLAILFMAMEKGTNERMIENLVKYNTGYIQIRMSFSRKSLPLTTLFCLMIS